MFLPMWIILVPVSAYWKLLVTAIEQNSPTELISLLKIQEGYFQVIAEPISTLSPRNFSIFLHKPLVVTIHTHLSVLVTWKPVLYSRIFNFLHRPSQLILPLLHVNWFSSLAGAVQPPPDKKQLLRLQSPVLSELSRSCLINLEISWKFHRTFLHLLECSKTSFTKIQQNLMQHRNYRPWNNFPIYFEPTQMIFNRFRNFLFQSSWKVVFTKQNPLQYLPQPSQTFCSSILIPNFSKVFNNLGLPHLSLPSSVFF